MLTVRKCFYARSIHCKTTVLGPLLVCKIIRLVLNESNYIITKLRFLFLEAHGVIGKMSMDGVVTILFKHRKRPQGLSLDPISNSVYFSEQFSKAEVVDNGLTRVRREPSAAGTYSVIMVNLIGCLGFILGLLCARKCVSS